LISKFDQVVDMDDPMLDKLVLGPAHPMGSSSQSATEHVGRLFDESDTYTDRPSPTLLEGFESMRPNQTTRVNVYIMDGNLVNLKVPVGKSIRDLQAFFRDDRGVPYFYVHGSSSYGLSDALSPDTVISTEHRALFLMYKQKEINMTRTDTLISEDDTYATRSRIEDVLSVRFTEGELDSIRVETVPHHYIEFGVGLGDPVQHDDINWHRAGSPNRLDEIHLSWVDGVGCVRYNDVIIPNPPPSTSPLWLCVKLFPDTSVKITQPGQSGGNPDGITVVVPPTKEGLSQMARMLTRRERWFLLKSLTSLR